LKVKFSPRARRRVKVLSSWWKANRPSAPRLFDEELEQAVERLKSQPTLGLVYQALDGEVVRRMLLSGTQQHVYYVVNDEQGVVVIYTIWGGRRGRGPKL
jgi:plasmid stabilization system protein ParE